MRPIDDEDEGELYEKYDIERCVEWITKNAYDKICLQFPDNSLNDAIRVENALGKRTNAELFVLADATFRSCCVDFKTAKHANADALIHFGRTCSSYYRSSSTLFVLPKEPLNVNALVECVTSLVERKRCNMVLLYDVAFAHYADEMTSRLSNVSSRVDVSRLLINDDDDDKNYSDAEAETVTDENERHTVRKLGRRYRVRFKDEADDLIYLYVTSSSSRKNFENFLLSSPESTFYTYDSGTNTAREQNIPRTIKKTLFLVEKVKRAARIGILVATLEAHCFLAAVRRIKNLCAAKKKKTYVICVGKPNVAKLANFPEIDLFVMISCPEVEIIDRKEYFQTIVSTMEIELALNDNYHWMGKYVADFNEFLRGGSEYRPTKKIGTSVAKGYAVDVSLLQNDSLAYYGDHNEHSDVGVSVTSRSIAISLPTNSPYDLSNRSWSGLRTRTADITPVSEVSVGREGTPAGGYFTRFSERAT